MAIVCLGEQAMLLCPIWLVYFSSQARSALFPAALEASDRTLCPSPHVLRPMGTFLLFSKRRKTMAPPEQIPKSGLRG